MKTTALLVALLLAGCASETDEEKAPTEEVKAPVEEDTAKPAYPSSYGSNCYCLACSKYCDVDGKTTKSGICC